MKHLNPLQVKTSVEDWRINLYNSTEIKVAKSIFINWGPDPVSFSKEGYHSCLPENIAMSVWDFTGGSVI